MKKLGLIAILCVIMTSLIPTYASVDLSHTTKISIDGEFVQFNDELGYPFVDDNNRTQVPFRVTLETFGALVSWNGERFSAIAEKDGIIIEVPIKENYILKNGEKIENDTKALVMDGRTYLPIRAVMEAFGCTVDWDGSTKTVLISTKDEEVKSYKLFNEIFKINENVLVTINYNYELATIASTVGANFGHQGYLTPSLAMRNKVIEHFAGYTELEAAKMIYEYSIPAEVMPLKLLYSLNPFATNVNTFKNEIIINTNSFPRPREGSINSIEELNSAMEEFCNKTNARLFFEENYYYYEDMFSTFKSEFTFNYIERLSKFFGYDTNEKFIIYLTTTKPGGRADYLYDEKGVKYILHVINILSQDNDINLMTIYHELAHGFLDTAIKNNRSELEKYKDVINKVLSSNEQLHENKFDETVVRAIVVLMFEEYHGEDMAKKDLKRQLNSGWTNTDKIYNFIKNNYLQNINDYSIFDDFIPDLLKYLEGLS